MHVVKKFDTSAKLVEYLNGGAPIIQGTANWTQGSKQLASQSITSNTLSGFVDFENIDGSNTDLTGYVWISGMDNSGYADLIASVHNATTLVLTTNLGGNTNGVNYRVVPNKPIQTSDIFTISIDSSNLWVLIHNVEDKTFA